MKMQTFFRYHSKLEPFRIFSVEHVVTIGIIFALCIFLLVKKSEFELKMKRRYFRITLALLLLILDGLQHLWLVFEHAWSLKSDLPLQLSDLAVIIAVMMLLTKNYRLFQFMYFAGMGSSIQAILTPDLGKFSFPHIQYIEFFVRHGGVVLACLFMVVAFHYRPTIRSMWVTIIIVNLYAFLIYFLNKALESNYLYIMKKPANASLLNYLGPWPWYLLSMEIVMIVSFYILYSPFWIRKRNTNFD